MQEILSKTTYTNKFINFNSINNQKESIWNLQIDF